MHQTSCGSCSGQVLNSAFSLQTSPISSVSATLQPLLGMSLKAVPCLPKGTGLQGSCANSSSLPDVSSQGGLMSARSIGRPGGSGSASQQSGATAAANAACDDAGSSHPPGSNRVAHTNAVSVTQAGAFPVRQGGNGVSRPGLMPRRTLTHELFTAPGPLGCHTKQPSDVLPVAPTALQLTGSPYCCNGGSAAAECEHILRSCHTSASSDRHKAVIKASLDTSQLSESIAAPYVADSDGDSGLWISGVKPKQSTTARLGNTLSMLELPDSVARSKPCMLYTLCRTLRMSQKLPLLQ